MDGFRRAALLTDVPPGKAIAVEIEGKHIALFNVGGAIYAIGGVCTHRGGPLAEGNLRGTSVACPWHGTQFDVTNGQVVSPPATSGVACYPTKVDEESVWIGMAHHL